MKSTKMGGKKEIPLCTLLVLKNYSNKNKLLTQAEIINHLENDYDIFAERKSISSAIDILETNGFPVRKLDKGSYYEGIFTDGELKLLVDSILFSKNISKEESKILIDKLKNEGGESFSKMVKSIHCLDTIKHSNQTDFFDKIELLAIAIEEQKQVSFSYRNLDRNTQVFDKHFNTDIVVNPYQLVCVNGFYYLLGLRGKSDEISHYRVDRIFDLKTTENVSDISLKHLVSDKNLGKYLDSHPYMEDGAVIDVEVRFANRFLEYMEDFFGESLKIKQRENIEKGIFDNIATISVTKYEIIQWALLNPDKATIISPQKIRDVISMQSQLLYEKYNSTKEDIYGANLRSAQRSGELVLDDISLIGKVDYKAQGIKSKDFWLKDVRKVKIRKVETINFDFLKDYKYCNEIWLTSVDVDDLSVLKELPYLERIEIVNTGLKTLDFLRECKNIRAVALYGNEIDDFSPLYDIPHLEYLEFPNYEKMLIDIKKLKTKNPNIKINFVEKPYEIGKLTQEMIFNLNANWSINAKSNLFFTIKRDSEEEKTYFSYPYPANIMFDIFGKKLGDEDKKRVAKNILSKTSLERNIFEALDCLDYEKKNIVIDLYKNYMTLHEIGIKNKLSSDDVFQKWQTAIRKLRNPYNIKKLAKFYPKFDENGNIVY